jgi:Domain of unknown function (DUF4262)
MQRFGASSEARFAVEVTRARVCGMNHLMHHALPHPEDEADGQLLHDVETHGWHIVHVGVPIGEESTGPGWSYSVGLFRTFGHPEFIIVGIPPSAAEAVINDLGSRVKDGQRFRTGTRDADVLENYEVCFISMRMDQYRAHLGYALWFYCGMAFPVLQVVWPDRSGHFPWDSEWMLDALIQPVLGHVDEA